MSVINVTSKKHQLNGPNEVSVGLFWRTTLFMGRRIFCSFKALSASLLSNSASVNGVSIGRDNLLNDGKLGAFRKPIR